MSEEQMCTACSDVKKYSEFFTDRRYGRPYKRCKLCLKGKKKSKKKEKSKKAPEGNTIERFNYSIGITETTILSRLSFKELGDAMLKRMNDG